MQHVLALDLKDDPALIAEYEAHHRAVWPEVQAHLRRHGVTEMKIYRLGTRMVMVMHTDDAVYDAARMQAASESDPVLVEWEALMWKFQAPTPWTPKGSKWIELQKVFDFRSPPV
ncbi:L-rhamnose mutarotase [Variovorax robiniae]|uniref:L-rhamnose mutarotase n=1 Tax=Variovorax robiniae TaxID=1836199 RepID=A0ABU8X4Y4_9BURK